MSECDQCREGMTVEFQTFLGNADCVFCQIGIDVGSQGAFE